MKIKQCKICWKPTNPFLWKFCSKGCKKEDEKIKIEKLKEKKKISPRVLYKKNVELAKKIAKIKDNYTCQKCWSKEYIQWSHIINEARDHRLATYEYNIKALCMHCHLNWWHKNPLEASIWFDKKYPWRYEILNKLNIEHWKEWKISKEWHIQENERLNKILVDLQS
jgi:5-methylcytosine-specific restriction endonuclease McrA